MSRDAELSCDLDYTMSFWLWILSWKYLHFLEISTCRGYYPQCVVISTFCGHYLHFVFISVFCRNIHISWILSAFCGNIHILWKYTRSVDIIRILSLLYLTYNHLVKVTGASLPSLFITQSVFLFPLPFALFVFVSEYKLSPNGIRIYVPHFNHLKKS